MAENRLLAAFAYPLGFVSGALAYHIGKDDEFVRFHAIQSLFISAFAFFASMAFVIVLSSVYYISPPPCVFPIPPLAPPYVIPGLLPAAVGAFFLAAGFVEALFGRKASLPIIGQWAAEAKSGFSFRFVLPSTLVLYAQIALSVPLYYALLSEPPVPLKVPFVSVFAAVLFLAAAIFRQKDVSVHPPGYSSAARAFRSIFLFITAFSVVCLLFVMLGSGSWSCNVPISCTLPAGLSCYEYVIDANGSLYLELGQTLGRTINVTGLGCSAVNPNPDASENPYVVIESGHHVKVTDSLPCCGNESEPCRARLLVVYKYVGGNESRAAYGDISETRPRNEAGEGYPRLCPGAIAFLVLAVSAWLLLANIMWRINNAR
jgi:uncharacterized membrane protein